METKAVPELPKRKEVPVVGEHLRRLALQPVVVPRLHHPKGASLAIIWELGSLETRARDEG